MFTGLVQRVGALARLEARGSAGRIRVEHAAWPDDPLIPGESIAVEGACLSVAEIHDGGFSADVLQETLDRTCFRRLPIGAPVNLERAMKVGERFGGHIVSGHIDEVGVVREIRSRGPDSVLQLGCSADNPEDKFRYGYDFWLQEKTGLLLKWILLDANNKPLATLVFTEFALGSSINIEEIESDSRAEDFIEMKTFSLENTVVRQSEPRWKPDNLPPGFELASHNHKSGSDGVYEHMVYSDGLAAVSVYVEQQAPGSAVKSGVSQLGTNNAYIRQKGELQITVIGEVPALTVKSIADEMARVVASN